MSTACCARPASPALPDESGVARHLREIAREPRFAGSLAEDNARGWCRRVLEEHGFSITEEPFEFSEAIGRWMVPALAALVAIALGLVAAAWRAGGTPRASALALGVLAVTVWWVGVVATRRWVLTFPLARRTSVNLVATRGTPALWLMAHLDTKSQPMPTLVRAALLVAAGLAFVATLAAALAWPETRQPPWMLPLIGTVAGMVLSFATVGNASRGALDNGTGVAALLALVERLPRDRSLGIVCTSGEELGLAGARAWVRPRPAATAVNLDTLDDRGTLRCMVHGAPSRRLASQLEDSAQRTGAGALRISPLLPGLLTDGVALADAGWTCVTLSRGTVTTLGRIHRPGDSVEHVTGEGAERAVSLLHHFITTGT